MNKVPQIPQRFKIKVTPQTPGIKTQFFEYNPYKPIFMDYNFYFKDLRNIKQNLIKIDHHIKNLCCYISVNKVPKGLKIKDATNSWYQN